MAKYNAYMPLWVGDYLSNTSNLSTQRHGVYFLLIMHYWKHGCIPSDMEECYEIAKCRDDKCTADTHYIISKYFPDGKHARLDEELAAAKESYSKRVDAQKKAVESRKANCNANTKQIAKVLQSYDSDYDYDNDSKKEELPDFLSKKTWGDVKSHRRTIKKPMNARAEKLMLGKIEEIHKAGINVDNAVDMMVDKGWSSISVDWYMKEINKSKQPPESSGFFGSGKEL